MTPASFTTETGRHDIAELLLKMALNTKNQSINFYHQGNLKCALYEQLSFIYRVKLYALFIKEKI